MTVSEWIRNATLRLEAAGVESPRLEAQVLAGHVLLADRAWLVAHDDALFPDLAGETLLHRRENREPLAYIVGGREFYGRWFRVRPGVLIPRQDTEILVEVALEAIDALEERRDPDDFDALRILDIGVGSGAIAVTLKLERPETDVMAVDVSLAAISTARENAELLEANVEISASDLFGKLEEYRFDLVVSNPPYIAESETLSPEVAEHEPSMALFSGPTGLEIYRRLANEAKGRLTDSGSLIVEVGHTQAAAVKALFEEAGWTHLLTKQDLAGIDRVLAFRPLS
jgi:release factor glutamine methyltransferase